MRYHPLGILGEGSLGVVERVFDERLGRIVARKTLRDALRDDAAARRSFLEEARILGRLDHGAIIPIFDSFEIEDGRPAYSMRELAGESLARRLELDPRSGGVLRLPLERTLSVVAQLCEALAHAHERGVVHLDLKPQNVIVLAHEELVLVDWGSASLYAPDRRTQQLADLPARLRTVRRAPEDEANIVGTPRYMSPEQTEQPRSALGPASDIFSMGILFYQMLTGRLPFEGESLEELLFHIRETEPPAPDELDRGIHARLSALVLRMLEKDPEARPADMAQVLAELRAFRSTAAEFPLRRFEAGAAIFEEGDVGDSAYVLVEGEVEITTGHGVARRVLGRHVAGEAFGELALLRDMPRSAAATALVATQVRVIGRESLRSEVEQLSPWVLTILRDVAERFVDRSERLVELLRE